jgi:hypothetical protein
VNTLHVHQAERILERPLVFGDPEKIRAVHLIEKIEELKQLCGDSVPCLCCEGSGSAPCDNCDESHDCHRCGGAGSISISMLDKYREDQVQEILEAAREEAA